VIPKKVHITWKTKDLLQSESPIVTEGIKKLIELNPEWEVTIYDDEEVDTYLQKKLGDQYPLIADKHIVQKSDLWRLMLLFEEGGLYIDIDRFIDTPLDDLIGPSTRWVLPTCRDYDFSHDFMMTAPGNPAYQVAVNLYLQRLREGHNSIYFLGPQTYMHAITLVVMGEMINTDPGEEVFEQIRDKLNSAGFINTYREDPPYNTIVYRNGALGLNWEQEKRKFYAESGLKHWSGDW
jgi:mannosyltransferase OCH1-like enzyme